MAPFLLLALFGLIFLLVKSAGIVIESLRGIGREAHTATFIVSAVILSVATSFPELFVGISSAIQGDAILSLGNIVGANMANLGLVAGISAVVAGKIPIHGKIVFKEMAMAFAAAALPVLLILDGRISRLDGVILLVFYIIYNLAFFRRRFEELAEHHRQHTSFLKFFGRVSTFEKRIDHSLSRFLVGVTAMLACAYFVVKIAVILAVSVGTPLFLVGFFLISLGTTLPELVVSLKTLRGGESSIFFGNLLGSVIVNSTLILGVAGLISPITIATGDFILPAAGFLVVFLAFFVFAKTQGLIGRLEGVILMALYFFFVLIQFI